MLYKFSEFSDLGDLSQYSLQELNGKIKKMEVSEYTTNEYHYLVCMDLCSIFILEFYKDGKFKSIKCQKFKEVGIFELLISKLKKFIN
jgi:hypothetical protein